MSQAENLTLIAELQRSKRRWKILALGLLAVLMVLLVRRNPVWHSSCGAG